LKKLVERAEAAGDEPMGAAADSAAGYIDLAIDTRQRIAEVL
jgi:hypothetical protein